MTEDEHESYDGDVTLVAGATRIDTTGSLRGGFQPIDGWFHWYGRLAASAAVEALGSGATVVVTTPRGSADGRLSDVDTWGRMRVTGTGRPPF